MSSSNIYNVIPQRIICFDKLKLMFPKDLLIRYDKSYFNKNVDAENSDKNKSVLNNKFKPLGISQLSIGRYNATITFSSKLLAENYHKCLSINTIEEALDKLYQHEIIYFYLNEIIEQSTVLVADTVTDIGLEFPIQDYFPSLFLLSMNSKYNVTDYKTAYKKSGIDGVTAIHKGNSVNERLSFYHKINEILKDEKLKKVYLEYYRDFDNKMRVERNLKNKTDIRKSLHTNDNKLTSVLNSSANPNYDLFKKISKPVNFDVMEKKNNNETVAKYLKRKGTESLILECNSDPTAIKNALSIFPSHNQLPYVMKVLNEQHLQKIENKNFLLEEIEEKLFNY